MTAAAVVPPAAPGVLAVLGRYRKAIGALLGSLSAWGLASYQDGYSQDEWWALVAVVGTFIGVWAAPNNSEELGT